MALIVHRCTCGHADFQHSHGQCCVGWCRAAEHTYRSEPVVIATWNARTGEPEPLLEPGTELQFTELCDCGACRDLYEQQEGRAA